MSPVNVEHGRIVLQLGYLLKAHLKGRPEGVAVVEAGFTLARNPDTVRGPDIAFIRSDRIPPPREDVGSRRWPQTQSSRCCRLTIDPEKFVRKSPKVRPWQRCPGSLYWSTLMTGQSSSIARQRNLPRFAMDLTSSIWATRSPASSAA